jgi:hypothetical protein
LALLQKRLADSATDAQMQAQAARDFRQILEAGSPPIYQPIQAPNNIPLHPMPPASAPPSSVLRNMAQQTLITLREAQHQRMLEEARQLYETSQGRPDLVARLIDAYDPSQAAPLPPLRQNQPTEHDTYNPPVDPAVQQAFADLLNHRSFIPEDPNLIAHNLSYGQKPADLNEYIRHQQERTMADAHWQAQQAQARLAVEQAETERLKQNLLRMQQQVLAEGQVRTAQQQNEHAPIASNTMLNAGVKMDSVEASEKKTGPLGLGERAMGRKSRLPPMPLPFQNNQELFAQMGQHFVLGEGQPVEIDLGKLDFSDSVNIPKLLPKNAQVLMFDKKAGKLALEEAFEKKLNVVHKGDFTYIEFLEPFTNVSLHIPSDVDPRALVFGRMAVNMRNPEIVINHRSNSYTVSAELISPKVDRYLDDFDFNSEKRAWWKEIPVRVVHEGAPTGSTSFRIFAKKGTYSKFYRKY